MKKISAVIIDTYEDKKFASIAIKMVQRLPIVGNIYTFSDQPFNEIKGLQFIEIPPLASNNEYGKIVFDILPEIIADEHVLIFQWDGFPINPNNWNTEFLNYDYIGAPNGNWVGNGGFSIRSKKLLNTLKELNITIDATNPFDQPEDKIICTHKRLLLESYGIKYAPLDIASSFSYEIGPLNKNTLGFHSSFNFPFFLRESDLMNNADNIVSRISQPIIMGHYLNNCATKNMFSLLRLTLNNFHSKPNLLKTFQYLSATSPNNPILNLFKPSFLTSIQD